MKTKAQKKVSKVMREGYAGKLHSGSKHGPVVTNPAQMKAIAMSEAGLSKPQKKSTRGSPEFTDSEITQGYRKVDCGVNKK
jgi:hypothetical protein